MIKDKDIVKELKTNSLFIELFNNSSGFSIKNNTITFFNLKGYKKNVLKNRLKGVKDIIIKENTIKLVLG